MLPPLAGMPFKEAEKLLGEEGLQVIPEEQPSEEEKDEVLGSIPEAGTVVAPGDPVTLIVSTGKPEEEEADEDGEGDDAPGNSENAPGHDKGKGKEKDKDEE